MPQITIRVDYERALGIFLNEPLQANAFALHLANRAKAAITDVILRHHPDWGKGDLLWDTDYSQKLMTENHDLLEVTAIASDGKHWDEAKKAAVQEEGNDELLTILEEEGVSGGDMPADQVQEAWFWVFLGDASFGTTKDARKRRKDRADKVRAEEFARMRTDPHV